MLMSTVLVVFLLAFTLHVVVRGARLPPAACLGTGEYTGELAATAVQSALQLGYRCIDTAHEYRNQAAVGSAINVALQNASLQLKRQDIFVISKVEGGLTAAETTARLHADVAALGLGRIDLVLLHFPKALPGGSLDETIQEQWRSIAGFVATGGAAAGGVSQFCTSALAALDKAGVSYRPILNQVGLHVGMGPDPQGVVSTAAARKDMQLMAYSPLAEASPQLLHGPLLLSIARDHGPSVTAAQVALRWLSQKGIPYAVAATNPIYQAENLRAATSAAGFVLSEQELARLDSLTQPAGCPYWPGSACWALTCNRTL